MVRRERSADAHAPSDLDRLRLFGGTLTPLPGTAREVQAIAAAMRAANVPVQVLTDAHATRAALEAATPGRTFLHLATHGLAGARLVVLSACDTQRGARVGSSSLALPWAFFAGAPTIVASLWRVDDDASALLMERFYENLLGRFDTPRSVARAQYAPGEPMPAGRALLESKLWLRSAGRTVLRERLRARGVEDEAPPSNAEALTPYADPYFWSGFVLLGAAGD